MKHCKLKLLAALILTAVVLSPALALGGGEAVVMNEVNFSVSDSGAYIHGTRDNGYQEIATVAFQVAFDVASSAYLQEAIIQIEYDPEVVTFLAARPNTNWGTVTPVLIETPSPGNPTRVTYILDPDPGTSTIPVQTTPTNLAFFDFQVECAAQLDSYPITIIYGVAETSVDDGVDKYYVDDPARIDNGVVNGWGQYWSVWMLDDNSQVDIEGALGTTINVPVIAGTNFKLAGAEVIIGYDLSELEFVGIANWEDDFVDAVATPLNSYLVQVELSTDEAVIPRHEFHSETMFDLQFRVIGDWQGDYSYIYFFQMPTLQVAQNFGTCDTYLGPNYAVGGTIHIPAYQAAFTAQYLDGGTMSAVDDLVSLEVGLTNNFPAGGFQNSIISNLLLDSDLQNQGPEIDYLMDFGLFTFYDAAGDDVSLRAMPAPGFMDIASQAQPMVAFNITTPYDFTPPANYDDRFYPVTFQNGFDADPQFNAIVTDTTGLVPLTQANGGLTWTSPPPVEYLMGEFYCPYASAGQGTVTQEYFVRHGFDLHDFRVKIEVSGDHHMFDIYPEPGVEVEAFDDLSYKWAILKADANWVDQAATDTRTKFASIVYAYAGGSNLLAAKDRPGDGWYVTKLSTVSFVSDGPDAFYMDDPAYNSHHVVGVGNNIKNRWWVDGGIVDPDLPPDDQLDRIGWGVPVAYELQQNYPNPFNPSTDIVYGLPEACAVELSVYNIAGQRVATLVQGWQEAGLYRRQFVADDLASGIYFYHLTAGQQSLSRKMILMK